MVAKRRLAVFDLDGTLIHYEFDHFFEETLKILPELGYPETTLSDLARYFEEYNYFGFVPKKRRHDFEEKFWSLMSREHYPSPREIEGAVELLGQLVEREMTVAIATARSTLPEQLERELRGTGLLKYISLIATKAGHESKWFDKTHQLRDLCTRLSLSPGDGFMVGDTPPDIWSAKAVGMGSTIAVLSGGIAEHILKKENPDHLLDHVGEMKKLILPEE